MSAAYVLQQDGNGSFIFHLRTHSGQVLLTSGVYAEKAGALRALDAARHLAGKEKNYLFLTEEDGQQYFLVRDKKGEVLAQSNMYPDPESLRTAINLVKGNTHGARLEDQTQNPA